MLTEDLAAKIQNARTLSKPNPEAETLPYENIGELLFKQARYFDTKPYLVFYDLEGTRIEYGYKDFFMLVQQCANMMQSFGVKKGDRIATISHNHADTVIHYFAAWLLGACVVPVSLSEDDSRIQYIIENSNATLAYLRVDYAQRLLPLLKSVSTLQTVLLTGDRSEVFSDELYFDEELEKSAVIFTSPDAVRQEDEALIVYTSGTTGNPKGVVLTQRNLMLDAKGISEWHGLTNSQRMMCVLPIHHVNGTIVTLVTPMFFGGTIVLNQRFQSETFLPRIAEERVNVVSVVPTLLAFLIEHYKDRKSEIPSTPTLRHIICGAGPLTVELGAQFEDMLGITVLHGYGLSETTCYSCFLPTDLTDEEHKHWMRDHGFPSIGVALPQNEMMIADESGHEVAPGERGEIAIRGVNVMKYYYQNDEANEKTFSYGWFRSGDEGFYQLDHLGRKFFFITARLKELIIRGGVNISPLEIDEVLSRCPNVKAAIAVGFENDFYGEEVGAYVQPCEGISLSEDEVLSFCRQHLPHNKVPKVVVFGNDIPVTSTGKYQRNKCKPLFKEWKTAQFRKG
jgi:acyl-CoA synthetase (AMP-forming)/AMP-acid ligase II